MKKHEYTGYLEDLSPQQEEILVKLRDHMVYFQGITDPRFDDRYLLRFCRARKFDWPKVQLMWDNFIKWRRENQVNEIAELDVTSMKRTEHLFPHNYCGIDREGRPIYVERYKDFDLKEMTAIVDEKFLLTYYIYSYERLLHLVFPILTERVAPRVIEQSVTILDLDGLNFTRLLSKRTEIQQFMKLTSAIAQDNYPEIMGRLFVINAPFLFHMLWGLVKGFLDEKTVKKISILGGSYKKDLLKLIDEDQLPVFLGGRNDVTIQKGIFNEAFE